MKTYTYHGVEYAEVEHPGSLTPGWKCLVLVEHWNKDLRDGMWVPEHDLKEESMATKEYNDVEAQRRDDMCSEKARKRGQLTFTLVEQDRSAAPTICEWIKQNIMTAPPEKLHAALDSAIICRDFPNKRDAD